MHQQKCSTERSERHRGTTKIYFEIRTSIALFQNTLQSQIKGHKLVLQVYGQTKIDIKSII